MFLVLLTFSGVSQKNFSIFLNLFLSLIWKYSAGDYFLCTATVLDLRTSCIWSSAAFVNDTVLSEIWLSWCPVFFFSSWRWGERILKLLSWWTRRINTPILAFYLGLIGILHWFDVDMGPSFTLSTFFLLCCPCDLFLADLWVECWNGRPCNSELWGWSLVLPLLWSEIFFPTRPSRSLCYTAPGNEPKVSRLPLEDNSMLYSLQ